MGMRLDTDSLTQSLDEAPDHAIVTVTRPTLVAEHRDDVRIRVVANDAVHERFADDLEVGVGDGLVDDFRALLMERDPAALEVEMPATEPRHGTAPRPEVGQRRQTEELAPRLAGLEQSANI